MLSLKKHVNHIFCDDTLLDLKCIQTKKNLEDEIRNFFITSKVPIKVNQIDTIRCFAYNLTSDYEIDENNSNQQYDLSIRKYDCDQIVHYLELSCYGDSRLCIHLKCDKIEYTQYQISNFIFQFSDIENLTFDIFIYKIYDVTLQKYISGNIKFIGNDKTKTFKKHFNKGILSGLYDRELDKIVSIYNLTPQKYTLSEQNNKYIYDLSKTYTSINEDINGEEEDPRRYGIYKYEQIADDWSSKNNKNIYNKHYMLKNDLILNLKLYANHCNCNFDNLPLVIELPLDFKFVEEYYIFDNMKYNSKEKNIKTLVNNNIQMITMNDKFMHYNIRIGNYISGFEINVISEYFSNIPNILYEKACGLDNIILKELFFNKDIRLDKFFDVIGVPMISIKNYGDFNDNIPVIHRKQIYYNNEIIFDGISRNDIHGDISYSYDKNTKIIDFSNVNFESEFNQAQIFINNLDKVKTNFNFFIPPIIYENNIFIKQFIGSSYENYRFAHGYLNQNGNYHIEIYYVYYANNLIRKSTNIYNPKNMNDSILHDDISMNLIYDMKNGNVISEFIADRNNNQIKAKYTYKGYTILINFQSNSSIDDNPHINKKIMLDDIVIFEGEINDENPNIITNNLTSVHKNDLYYSDDLIKFISEPDIDIDRDGHDMHIKDLKDITDIDDYKKLPVSKYTTPISEILQTNDPDIQFEFKYDYPIKIPSIDSVIAMNWNITSYSFFEKMKQMIIEKRERKKLISITQRNYSNKGHEELNESIDEDNTFRVKTVSKFDIFRGRIGWKAAITENGDKCIIKLLIPYGAKVARDPKYNKYRTDKAITLSIKPVMKGSNNYYYKEEFDIEKCQICLDENKIADIMAEPCRHKLCDTCCPALLNSDNKKCPYCMQQVNKYQLLKMSSDDKKLSLPKAYSFVHNSDFVYNVGQEVTVNNFDGDLSKSCAPGIHYHRKEKHAFKWFEFLDIPDSIKEIIIPSQEVVYNSPLDQLEHEIKMKN